MSEAEVEREAEAENERPSLNWQSWWAVAVPGLIVLLSLAGIGVASYLTYSHWFDQSVACAGMSGCDLVAESDYAYVGEIPVAFLGLMGYMAILAVGALWLYVGQDADYWPLLIIWGMSLGGTAYSIYLTYLEFFVIEGVCIWCMTSAVIMLCTLLVSTLGLVAMSRESASPGGQ
jgi:uncharacterized membrane protein